MKYLKLLVHYLFVFCLFFITSAFSAVGNNEIKDSNFCPAPIINTFSPSSGPENTLITINGNNFNTASSVFIGGINTSFTIINDTQITALVPDGAADSTNISISSNGGCTGNSSNNFTVLEASCTINDIYFSELYDAQSGAYGVIELYNPTNTTVNLDGVYEILRYGDIGDSDAAATVISLTGSIAPLSTFIIQSDGSNPCTGFAVDFTLGAGFNDNDEFKLKKNGTVIDHVQAIDERGYTIIRNANAVAPASTFDSNDWYRDGFEDCSDLGSHTVNTSTTTPNITHPLSQEICENGNTSFTVSVDSGSYTYQWLILNSSGNWVNVNNNSNYSGATSSTLTILNASSGFSGNQYYCIMTSTDCDLVSNAVQLLVANPNVDILSNQTLCTSYTLPTLTDGNYFTGTNSSGSPLNAGDVISTSQTIYIYNEIGTAPNNCANESSFDITISGTPNVDTIANQTLCSSYTLPTLTDGNYFTGTNGSGSPLNAGDVISTSQTIYIYNEIGTAPNNCANESSFDITISGTPNVDTIADQTLCSSYTLPTLTDGNYFTGTNGSGSPLNAGDVISTSQTIYIYNEIGTAPNNCSNESNFDVTISGTPNVDTIANQTVCTSYTLPTLTDGNYFTGTNGSGSPLNAGDVISTDQTIYIYNEIGITPNTCSNESSFEVTIYPTTDFTLDASHISTINNTLIVDMTDVTFEYLYAVDVSSFQTSNIFNNLSEGVHTLYVSDENNCIIKSLTFEIQVDLHIPVFFTPNNDTVNDFWTVIDRNQIVKDILIFNRYGKLIKQLIPHQYSWDGFYNGHVLESNDFWYLITLRDGKQLRGHFALKH
ncbi:T9SS type B sorting domain-containing protein [Winogradskyella vidalii]|uniref:T9SS type B sorting domain-containing protein n=1 Tax=Winogradskyella vidalii TaxID=2615024 RepID=UPI0015C6CB05|nr:T9SS type B sorting domain-containing protein [Winogradskyella vidalii]